jgi:integrase
VTLAEAREVASKNRFAARRGGQPFAERQQAAPTFKQAAERTLEANASRWAASTVRTWIRPLVNHVFPKIGGRRVDQISRQDVIDVLAPIWSTKAGESGKALQRVRSTFEWARAHSHVQENPCASIKAALPAQTRTRKHHEALPYSQVGAALRAIAGSRAPASAKACARFIALTACRSAEGRGATFEEIDMEAREWRIPASRMDKGGAEHRVPLSDAAMSILAEQRSQHPQYCFPSPRTGRALSHAALFRVVRDACGAVPHGFRTSLRTWAAEQTSYPHAVCEMALAHQVGSAVERSYARSDLFERRRDLMQAWADYLAK